jgi:hypothetical protein
VCPATTSCELHANSGPSRFLRTTPHSRNAPVFRQYFVTVWMTVFLVAFFRWLLGFGTHELPAFDSTCFVSYPPSGFSNSSQYHPKPNQRCVLCDALARWLLRVVFVDVGERAGVAPTNCCVSVVFVCGFVGQTLKRCSLHASLPPLPWAHPHGAPANLANSFVLPCTWFFAVRVLSSHTVLARVFHIWPCVLVVMCAA